MENKKINFSNFFYFMAWIIYVISYMFLKQSEFTFIIDNGNIYKFIQVIVAFILMFKIIFIDKNNFKRLLFYSILSSIFLISAYVTKYEFLLLMFLFVIGSRNIDFRRFLKLDILIKTLILILIVSASLLNVIPNFTKVVEGVTKYAFGFYHPNTLGLYITTILLEYVYLKKCKLKLIHYIIFIFVMCIIFLVCKSRASVYLFLFILGFIFILNFNKGIYNNKFFKSIMVLLPIFMVLIGFIFINLYQNKEPLGYKIDRVLTSRVKNATKFMTKYEVNLFGNELKIINTRESIIKGVPQKILDMGYIRLLLNNGAIILLLILLSQMFLQYYAVKNRKNNLLAVNSYFIILGLVETYVYIVAFNFILVLLMSCIDENRKKEKFTIKEMADIIYNVAKIKLKEISIGNGFKDSNNGPYYCSENPVRNTSHYINLYKYLWLKTGDKKYKSAIKKLADFISNKKNFLENGSIKCLYNNDKMDYLNGLIGQAWVIEGLIAAYQVINEYKYYNIAKKIFLSQKYDYEKHLWLITNSNESYLDYEKVLNHQLWFAASGIMILKAKNDDEIKKMTYDFMLNIDKNIDIYDDGLLKHWVKDMRKEKKETLKLKIRNKLKFLSFVDPRFDKRYYEKGYHLFSLYAFAMIFEMDPSFEIYKSERFKKILSYGLNINELNKDFNIDRKLKYKLSKVNKFTYSYNSPAFLYPFIDMIFNNENNKELYDDLIDKQIKLTYNNKTNSFDKNTDDYVILTARLYELTRYLERKIEYEK